jgi:hypothetical protein
VNIEIARYPVDRSAWRPPADAPHRASFACLWDEINGDRALWKSNPWVWVVEFKRAEPTPGQTEGGR